MAKYLVDTNILIDHLRGNLQVTEFLTTHTSAISVVTVVELIQGCRNPKELKQVNTLISDFEILYIDYSISQLATNLVSNLYLTHGIKFLDALIAATAIKHQLILKTQESKHFKCIKDLTTLP